MVLFKNSILESRVLEAVQVSVFSLPSHDFWMTIVFELSMSLPGLVDGSKEIFGDGFPLAEQRTSSSTWYLSLSAGVIVRSRAKTTKKCLIFLHIIAIVTESQRLHNSVSCYRAVLSNLFDTGPLNKLFLGRKVHSKATTEIYWLFVINCIVDWELCTLKL